MGPSVALLRRSDPNLFIRRTFLEPVSLLAHQIQLGARRVPQLTLNCNRKPNPNYMHTPSYWRPNPSCDKADLGIPLTAPPHPDAIGSATASPLLSDIAAVR